jgi:Ca-activated chloride channel family protein
MSFGHPWVLVLLVAPLWLLHWTWRREGRRVALPFDHGRPRRGRGWRYTIALAESLPALLLGVLVLMLAGPQRLGEPKARRSLTNIEFCVDVSGSMTAPYGPGTRYDASMKAIDQFLTFREGDAFGLTFFGNSVLHWVPLTTDVSAIRCSPPFMRPEVAPPWMGGTEIGKALLACRKILADREEGDRLIVLVSDGFSSDLMNGNDESVARQLKADGIVVYHIHAAESEIPGEVVNIAALTGGEAFAAGDPAALEAVFARIDSMHKAKLVKTTPETLDYFEPFCMAGLCLLGTLGLAQFGLRYTPW